MNIKLKLCFEFANAMDVLETFRAFRHAGLAVEVLDEVIDDDFPDTVEVTGSVEAVRKWVTESYCADGARHPDEVLCNSVQC